MIRIEKNPRAIRFYEKNGFVAFNMHVFKMGYDVHIDIMMRKPLTVIGGDAYESV